MALNTLEHRYIAQVDWVLEGFVRLVAKLAFVISERTQIDRMLEWSGLRILFRWSGRVVDHCVADVAVACNHFAVIADMLAVVTAEASREI